MALIEVIRGTTHRFDVYFKDDETKAVIAMTDGTVKAYYYYGGVLQTTDSSPTKVDTGHYFSRNYFNDVPPVDPETDPPLAPLGEWEIRFYGETAAGAIKKQPKLRFKLTDTPTLGR